MSFDWITVAAQTVNFLVLIWLLKRFLYRPILDGIDARERDIKARVAAADTAKAEAEAAALSHTAALEEIASRKAVLIEAAQAEADAVRARLREETDRIIEAERAGWTKQKATNRAAYAEDLRAAGAGALLSLTRKALADLADADLEERIVTYLGAHLAELGGELKFAANKAEDAVAVSSAPLTASSRESLTTAFHMAVADIPLRFETDEDQSAGIVLRYGGGRISWTIGSYLDGLEAELTARIADGRMARRAAQ